MCDKSGCIGGVDGECGGGLLRVGGGAGEGTGCCQAGGGEGEGGLMPGEHVVIIGRVDGPKLAKAMKEMAEAAGGSGGDGGKTDTQGTDFGRAGGDAIGHHRRAAAKVAGLKVEIEDGPVYHSKEAEAELGKQLRAEAGGSGQENPGPTRTDMSDKKGDPRPVMLMHLTRTDHSRECVQCGGDVVALTRAEPGRHRVTARTYVWEKPADGIVPCTSIPPAANREPDDTQAMSDLIKAAHKLKDRQLAGDVVLAVEEAIEARRHREAVSDGKPFIHLRTKTRAEVRGFRAPTEAEMAEAQKHIDAGVQAAADCLKAKLAPGAEMRKHDVTLPPRLEDLSGAAPKSDPRKSTEAEPAGTPRGGAAGALHGLAEELDRLGRLGAAAAGDVGMSLHDVASALGLMTQILKGRSEDRAASKEQVPPAIHQAEAAVGERQQESSPARESIRACNILRPASELDTAARRAFKIGPTADDYREANEAIAELTRRAAIVEEAFRAEMSEEPGGIATAVDRVADALAAARQGARELAQIATGDMKVAGLGLGRGEKWHELQSWACVRDAVDAALRSVKVLVDKARRQEMTLGTAQIVMKGHEADLKALAAIAAGRKGVPSPKSSEARAVWARLVGLATDRRMGEELSRERKARADDREVIIQATGTIAAVKLAYPSGLAPGWDSPMDDRLWEVAVQRAANGMKLRRDMTRVYEQATGRGGDGSSSETDQGKDVLLAVSHLRVAKEEIERGNALLHRDLTEARAERDRLASGNAADDLERLMRQAAGNIVLSATLQTKEGRFLHGAIERLANSRGLGFEEGTRNLARRVMSAIAGRDVDDMDPEKAVEAARQIKDDLDLVAAVAKGVAIQGRPQTYRGKQAFEAVGALWDKAEVRGKHSAKYEDALRYVTDMAEGRVEEALRWVADGKGGVGPGAILAVHRLREDMRNQLSTAVQEIERLKRATVTPESIAAAVADGLRRAGR